MPVVDNPLFSSFPPQKSFYFADKRLAFDNGQVGGGFNHFFKDAVVGNLPYPAGIEKHAVVFGVEPPGLGKLDPNMEATAECFTT